MVLVRLEIYRGRNGIPFVGFGVYVLGFRVWGLGFTV